MRKISGIYAITNSVNQKRYYGSSVNVRARIRQHLHALRSGGHHNPHLQAAWNLYGEAAFVFSLVDEVRADHLLVVEQRYLDGNGDGYNVSRCAESAARGLKWSVESRAGASDRRRGKRLSKSHRQALSIAGTGRRLTAAHRMAMSLRMKGNRLGDSVREKISASIGALWGDANYRERMLSAQRRGMDSDSATINYSNAATARWSDPKYREKMTRERKSRWADPSYRRKMIEIRVAQGERARIKNREKREVTNAFSQRA